MRYALAILFALALAWTLADSMKLRPVAPDASMPSFKPVEVSPGQPVRAHDIADEIFLRPIERIAGSTLQDQFLHDAHRFVLDHWGRINAYTPSAALDFSKAATIVEILRYPERDVTGPYETAHYIESFFMRDVRELERKRGRLEHRDVVVGSKLSDAWVCARRTSSIDSIVFDVCYRVRRLPPDVWTIVEQRRVKLMGLRSK